MPVSLLGTKMILGTGYIAFVGTGYIAFVYNNSLLSGTGRDACVTFGYKKADNAVRFFGV